MVPKFTFFKVKDSTRTPGTQKHFKMWLNVILYIALANAHSSVLPANLISYFFQEKEDKPL